MAENTVRIEGAVTTTPSGTQTVSGTVTANQGTAAATAAAWPTKLSNGTSTVDVAPTNPSSQGNALLVTTGLLTAPITLNAASAVAAGTVVDFGAAKANISMMFVGTASAGTVVLEVSHDNSTWFQTSTPIAVTTTPQNIAVTGNAFRYARGRITATVTAGTVTATIMAT